MAEPAGDLALPPGIFSKEPPGPVGRKRDARWSDIVRWTYLASLTGEELGIAQADVDSFAASTTADMQRCLGRTGDPGRMVGAENEFAARIIRQVGNVGALWERSVTPLGTPRGVNELWAHGGLMYAPPMR